MANTINKDDLMKRFSKQTELFVKLIEDDSSDGTQVKILHLVEPVQAVGSNVTSEGTEMKLRGDKVYVAAEDIDKFWENVEETENGTILRYNGPMHLDVSKPNGRTVGGQFSITKPAKIWLTATKFSKRGGQLRQGQTNNLNAMVNKMFAGGRTFDLGSETAVTSPAATGVPATTDPEVVVNQEKVVQNGDKNTIKANPAKVTP